MTSRLTLEKLISHVESLYGIVEESVDLPGKIEQIDKVSYNTLEYGSISSIANIPPNLRALFDPYLNNVKRHGVMNVNEQFNYSLYFSLLMCISNKFNTYEYNDQVIMINVLHESLLQSINILYETNNYINLGWKKTELRNAIQKYEFNKMILQYISDFLYINIFLVNISDDKLYLTYSEDYFNIYKTNIFLSYYNNTFEPLSFNDSKIINFQDVIFKKIINVHKKNINLMTLNLTKNTTEKIFEIKNENLEKYIKTENPVTEPIIQEEIKKVDKVKIEEVINVEEDIENKFTEIDLDSIGKLNNKMKLSEIQDIAKKYDINLSCGTLSNGKTKYKTKDALITEIKNINK